MPPTCWSGHATGVTTMVSERERYIRSRRRSQKPEPIPALGYLALLLMGAAFVLMVAYFL